MTIPTILDTVTRAEPVAIHRVPEAEVTVAPMGPTTSPKPKPLTSRSRVIRRFDGSTAQRLTSRYPPQATKNPRTATVR